MFKRTKSLFLGLIVLFLFPSVAPGQAVFLVKKALGLISHIADQTHRHETASVLLEADADKVFTSAEKIIRKKAENEILSTDTGDKSISFRHGDQAISIKVVRLQDDLTQVLVVSSGNNTPRDTNYVVNGILRICKEVDAHCWVPKE